jgi:hypothetical protein
MTVTVARAIDEVERIRGAWSDPQGDAVTSDPDSYVEVLHHGENVRRPHPVLLERPGGGAGMVAAVFGPTLRGVRVNAVRTTTVAGNRLGTRVLGSDRLARAKRAWRSRITKLGSEIRCDLGGSCGSRCSRLRELS